MTVCVETTNPPKIKQREGHLISAAFFQMLKPSLILRKTSNKFKLRGSPQNTCPPHIKVVKNKERTRSHKRPKEIREIELNELWYTLD